MTMAKRFAAPKGTRDLLPPETAIWAEVEAVARRVFALYGYREIRTPLFEETELFARGVGETTDIVGKEMYSFTDKGGRSITLRPESTAAVCRAYVEHGMQQWPQPVRLFYIGPQFRYERPQKGRYRQFHQIGAELIGGGGPEADVEVILLLVRFLKALGFDDLKVLLNTVGDPESRALYRAALVAFLEPRKQDLSAASQARLMTNPLRILDSKAPEDQKVLEGAPKLSESLTFRSRTHFAHVEASLREAGVEFTVAERLVRGLDYYTHTVFEVTSEHLGAQNSICGGGAYEGLVSDLGGPASYGVGFAIGEDRLVDVLPEPARKGLQLEEPVRVRAHGSIKKSEPEASLDPVSRLLEELRDAGVPAIEAGNRSPLKDSMLGISAVWITLGEDELGSGELEYRPPDGELVRGKRSEVIAALARRFAKGGQEDR